MGRVIKLSFFLPVLISCITASVAGQDCFRNSVGITALQDLAVGDSYQGFEGGLYPGGVSARP